MLRHLLKTTGNNRVGIKKESKTKGQPKKVALSHPHHQHKKIEQPRPPTPEKPQKCRDARSERPFDQSA